MFVTAPHSLKRVVHGGEALSASQLNSPLTEQYVVHPETTNGQRAAWGTGGVSGPPGNQHYYGPVWQEPVWYPYPLYSPPPFPLSAPPTSQKARENGATSTPNGVTTVRVHDQQKRDSEHQNTAHTYTYSATPQNGLTEKKRWFEVNGYGWTRTLRVDVREVEAWSVRDGWELSAYLAHTSWQSLGGPTKDTQYSSEEKRYIALVPMDRIRSLQYPVSSEIIAIVNLANQWISHIAQEATNVVVRARPVSPFPASSMKRPLGAHLGDIFAQETGMHLHAGVYSKLIKAIVQIFLADWCVDIIQAHYPRQKTFADLLVEVTAQNQANCMFVHFHFSARSN